jgi:hypothetical protein
MNDTLTPLASSISVASINEKANIEFQKFLNEWDVHYKNNISKIDLFNEKLIQSLPQNKKEYFVKAFYHIRGHFHDFLWYMGNHAPNTKIKRIILGNIGEEFGGNYGSHESLYYDFAKSLAVDIKKEIMEETTYEDFIVRFNKGHLKWLYQHDWTGCLAAFSAYEHLDNVDYIVLSKLASNLGVSNEGLIFFKVHEGVKHFEPLLQFLLEGWEESPEKIEEGFNFIGSHQLKMWQDLSDRIFSD